MDPRGRGAAEEHAEDRTAGSIEAAQAQVASHTGPGRLRRFAAWLVEGHRGPLLLLAALHVLVFVRSLFVVAGGIFNVPWDFDNSYHRFLVYIGDCFRSGALPLWNPYAAAGTPFFVHPQSQIWSPVTLVLASLAGYTRDLAQRQLILTVLLGGVGAYLLAFALWRSRAAAFVSALCFDLTSAVFSNMEHMDIINAYALLPWTFWAATRAAAGYAWSFPLLGFLLYWQVTWGYPAVVMMGLLWLAVWWIYLALTTFRTRRERLRFVASGAASALLGVGLSAVHWLPIMAHRSAFLRGAPLDIDDALNGGLAFPHLWGALFNFMTWSVPEGSTLDLSMVGLYFGVVAIPLLVVAIVQERSRIGLALMIAAAVMLLMSLGGSFFVRYALHWLFPAFNLSRVPAADSRTSMVLCLALLAGRGLQRVADDEPGSRALAVRACGWLMVVLLGGMVAWRSVAYRDMPQATYLQRVVGGTTAELLFLFGMVALLRRQAPLTARATVIGFVALLALDLGTDVALNYSVIGARESRKDHKARLATYRHTFDDLAAVERPRLVVAGHKPGDEYDQWAMLGLTTKEFYLNDYGGFRLVRYVNLLRDGYAGWLINGPRVAALPPGAAPATFAEFQAQLQPVEYRVLAYRPLEVRYQVRATRESLLVFNEIAFPGWKAWIDASAQPMGEVAGGLRALTVAPGSHEIMMRFQPRVLDAGLAVSLASLAVFLGWLALSLWRRDRPRPL
jgi:hypothetical protein